MYNECDKQILVRITSQKVNYIALYRLTYVYNLIYSNLPVVFSGWICFVVELVHSLF